MRRKEVGKWCITYWHGSSLTCRIPQCTRIMALCGPQEKGFLKESLVKDCGKKVRGQISDCAKTVADCVLYRFQSNLHMKSLSYLQFEMNGTYNSFRS